jgi:subtilisin-like proprotein convertase family protein
MGGTSMATPLTAGAIGLIREYLRVRQHLANPSAALLKATVIAGARRLAGSDPSVVLDNNQGFGRVDLDSILAPAQPATTRFIDRSAGLRTGDVHTEQVTVASRYTPLRVVMAYTDSPGPNLVNNLNLMAISPDGTRFTGNATAGGGLALDTTNNVEALHIANPTPGAWTLQVIGSNVPMGPQDFALVVLGHFGEPLPPQGVIEVEGSPNLGIPDNAPHGVSSTLHVAESGGIAGIRVTVDIGHTYIGDLRVSIRAPAAAPTTSRKPTIPPRRPTSADWPAPAHKATGF